jgi:hypothetical protein
MTFKVVIAYLSCQETDRPASWGHILLQIPRSQDSDDMHNSKTSAAKDDQEDLASNRIIEQTSHPASNIDMAKQQANSSVSANKIGGHIFNDVRETDNAIEKSILTILDKPSRCVAEWVDANSVPFICSALNSVVKNNWQNKI